MPGYCPVPSLVKQRTAACTSDYPKFPPPTADGRPAVGPPEKSETAMAGRKENLKSPRSTEEARERGRKGGIASGQARRKKRALREYLEARLEIMTGDVSTAEAITAALVDKALSGDMLAYETIRDTLGQNPRQMVETEVSGGLGLHHEVTPVVGALLARLVKEEEGQA